MVKAVIFLVNFLVIYFNSSDSATMECKYEYYNGQVTGGLYTCKVSKGITITSPDTAYINSTTGSHQSGHNNDNVNYLLFYSVSIYYFPRGLDAIFKNLKGIQLNSVGFKEIHQSDLKPFPELIEFFVESYNNQLEILEEGLFDFNPKLEFIYLFHNKITHIDPKIFDSLPKLRYLELQSNTCINKNAQDRTAVQNLIKEVKTMCNHSDYSILNQKLKFLESESKSLNFNDFKEELENLESKVNASKFINFYQTKLQNLKIILDEKLQKVKNCSTLNVKFPNFITNLKNLTAQVSNEIENVSQEFIKESTINQQCMLLNDSFAKTEAKISSLIEKVESESKATHDVIKDAINTAVEKIEKKLMEKLEENLMEINKKVQESETRFNERTSKIIKALKVIFDA